MIKLLRLPVLICLIVSTANAINLFPGIVLDEPYGARSKGMGNTGYALAGDESVLFFNPAGLGIANDRWNGGAAGVFRESLVKDISLTSVTVLYQSDYLKNAGFGANVYHLGLGTIDKTDSLGNRRGSLNSYELAVTLGGGYTFFADKAVTHSLGMAVKYFRSTNYWKVYDIDNDGNIIILPGKYNAFETGPAVSFDAGYLMNLFNHLRLGFVIKNMGPKLRVKTPLSSSDEAQPLIVATGVGYRNTFAYRDLTLLDLAGEISISRTHFTDDIDNTVAAGMELLFLRTMAFRFGYNFVVSEMKRSSVFMPVDPYSHRLCLGSGLRLFNHFEFDVHRSQRLDEHEKKSVGISFAFTRAFKWSKTDLKWWLRNGGESK